VHDRRCRGRALRGHAGQGLWMCELERHPERKEAGRGLIAIRRASAKARSNDVRLNARNALIQVLKIRPGSDCNEMILDLE
jgi:hypothetical protein